ncbi:MAG: DUF3471 domain-containing protein [Candidatus Competibacteraceae bacterium]|nr:DUF3471 domain-containing protein [Candidatus Competibacteraceae bacterium]
MENSVVFVSFVIVRFNPYWMGVPQQRCTVAVLANGLPTKPGLEPGALSRAIAAEFLAEEMRSAPHPEEDKGIDPAGFAALAGRYDYKSGVLTVTVEGECLFAQITGQPKHPLFAKSNSIFFWKVTDAQIEFLRDEQGAVIAVQHSQGGNSFRAPAFPTMSRRLAMKRSTPSLVATATAPAPSSPSLARARACSPNSPGSPSSRSFRVPRPSSNGALSRRA